MTTRYRRRPDVLWRGSLDTVVVLAAGDGEPVAVGGSGPELWALLADWCTLEHIADRLAQRFGASTQVVAHDVAPTLAKLVGAAVVEAVEDDAR